MPFPLSRIALVAALCLSAVPGGVAAQIVDVRIANYKYAPETVTVKTGTVVRWTNDEKRVSHSILFLGPGGYESERIFGGETFERRFEKPGRYPYTCGPHAEMKGLVVVE